MIQLDEKKLAKLKTTNQYAVGMLYYKYCALRAA